MRQFVTSRFLPLVHSRRDEYPNRVKHAASRLWSRCVTVDRGSPGRTNSTPATASAMVKTSRPSIHASAASSMRWSRRRAPSAASVARSTRRHVGVLTAEINLPK